MKIESMDAVNNKGIDILQKTHAAKKNSGADKVKVAQNVSVPYGTHQDIKIEDSGNISGNNEKVSDEMIKKAIDRANKKMTIANRSLQFSVHEKTKDIMVKVIDTQTNEVIREIPSEKILDMIANMLEMAGLLVDERR